MASTAAPDMPVTLKINYDGLTRRFKLPLRDLGVNTLEGKLRGLLQISQDTSPLFERYSDSAASYVVLDPSNISVYKQLYRAAKAKQKLKLRVTSRKEQDEDVFPKPATVEDVPESSDAKDEPESSRVGMSNSAALPAGLLTVNAPQTPEDFPIFVEQWLELGQPRLQVRRNSVGIEVVDFYDLSPEADFDEMNIPMPDGFQFSKAAAEVSFVSLVREAQDKRHDAIQPEPARQTQHAKQEKQTSISLDPGSPFTVCCNKCDRAVPDIHFHCSTCDDGDFDLCQDCVNQGFTCYDENHWLIKRAVKNGTITYSTTHVVPKVKRLSELPKIQSPETTVPFNDMRFLDLMNKIKVNPTAVLPLLTAEKTMNTSAWANTASRTCNSCVLELQERDFLHCTTCDDYDLCERCFVKDQHGHHPKHGFVPVVKDKSFSREVASRLAPGRNIIHNALCDGCDEYIRGVRHKCLDCPDWDYCSQCVVNADLIHEGHRFVPIYEPIRPPALPRIGKRTSFGPSVHVGICCDGPLCVSSRGRMSHIVGDRYKCAVCDDVDFCANCEASPANQHNKTHPLIKFKTPVRHVTVSTSGEHEDGQRLPPMGDRHLRARTSNRATETSPSPSIAVNPVQTVADVKPTDAREFELPSRGKPDEVQAKQENLAVEERSLTADDLVAVFQHDTVADGTVLPPDHTFSQTWVLKNDGQVAWPAGCSLKFVGGDYMGAVDPSHPADVVELVSASESNVCEDSLGPGETFAFTVQMRTPPRAGKVISYWRLTTQDGLKFGHRLWCDVDVAAPKTADKPEEKEGQTSEIVKSQMIIPKLEHESPSASLHMTNDGTDTETQTGTESTPTVARETDVGEIEDYVIYDDDSADDSDDDFMTDEEYDILDASDEEFLSEQQQKMFPK